MSEIKMYELLKNSMGEKEAETFVYLIDEKMEKRFEQRKHELATKEDVSLLRISTKEDISALRSEVKEDIAMLRAEFREGFSAIRVEFKQDIAAVRTELSRTIFLVSIGQLVAIVASVVSLVMFLKK